VKIQQLRAKKKLQDFYTCFNDFFDKRVTLVKIICRVCFRFDSSIALSAFYMGKKTVKKKQYRRYKSIVETIELLIITKYELNECGGFFVAKMLIFQQNLQPFAKKVYFCKTIINFKS